MHVKHGNTTSRPSKPLVKKQKGFLVSSTPKIQ